ncbi:hypothetical protein [Hymenobacter weizhouensis]|uniref:hypothetical protein n=1 Tax=Hymenobacter sp. YIM 151500-1 TaxID=2987689 RepID=UPI00222674E0|nr:hypothetical protein [Hymenobacter sp. YIM 151500-1]UYZ64681.1 hypothetical protein OIS53_07485 [Hymenobacter sp. YIM 151500-1]
MIQAAWIARVAGMVVLAGSAAAAQAQPQASAAPSAAHRQVAGTHVWLVPPVGFGPSAGLTGLRKGEAVVQVMDLAGTSFYQHAAGFGKARFEARGARVVDFQELTVQGYPARLVQLEQAGAPSSVQLLFGDSTFAALLVGRYPAPDAATGAAVRQALLSAAYEKNAAAPSAGAVFVLDEKKAGFTLKKASATRYEYALSGSAESASGPVLVVRTVPYHPSRTAADISQEQLERMAGLSDYRARRTSSVKVNDLVTFETEGPARQQGRPVLLYQQVTIIGSSAVVLQGIAAPENGDVTVAQFKALAHTIKPAAPAKKP